MALSDSFMNSVIDHMLRNQAFTPASAVYLSLHTGDPGKTGASEVTGGSYSRQAMALAAGSGGATSNSDAEAFTGMPSATVTHVGLWSASTSGTFYMGGALSASKTAGAGDTISFAVGEVDISFS